jgi:large subunit ribosomal protein L24e
LKIFQQFRFCRKKCRKAFNRKKNPRKAKWTKVYRKLAGKELTIDPCFEFEKRRNVPTKYDRELWTKTIDAIKKINEIKERREKHFVMERLRKGTQREIHNDVRDVQKNISLIRAPEGIRKKEQDKAMELEEDEEEIQYMDAREMEKKLNAGEMIHDEEMMAN